MIFLSSQLRKYLKNYPNKYTETFFSPGRTQKCIFISTLPPFHHILQFASSIRKLLKSGVLCNNQMFKSLGTSKTQYKDENLEACLRLAKILDISEDEVRSIGKKVPRVLSRDVDNIIQIVKTLKKYGLLEAAKTTHPILLCQKATVFENYLLILKESGINASPDNPLVGKRYHNFKSKTIQQLKPDPIPHSFDVVQNYIKVLDFDEDTANKLYRKLPSKPELLTLEGLRTRVIEFYISKAWDCSRVASKDIVGKNPRITKRSLAWTKQSTEILQTEFHIPLGKPLTCPWILLCNPENLLELTKVKFLGNVPLNKMVCECPKILKTSAKALLEIESILKKYEYPIEMLSNYPRIYCLDPETVKSRLVEIKTHPKLRHYLHHNRLPDLVYSYNTAKERIDSLPKVYANKGGIKVTIDRLCGSKVFWNRFCDEGFVNIATGLDTLNIILRLFPNKTKCQVRTLLDPYPNWRKIDIGNIIEVYEYILSFKPNSEESLFECLPILLYSLESVQESVKIKIESGEAKLEDPDFISKVQLYLERNYHPWGWSW